MTIQTIPDQVSGETQASGLFTRMGSYGASVINAHFFQQLVQLNNPKYISEIEAIIKIEAGLVSTLRALNIIGFFSPLEWLDTHHEGRLLIILLYLQDNPREVTTEIRNKLKKLQPEVSIYLQAIIEKVLI